MDKNKKIIITVVGIIVIAVVIFALAKIFSGNNTTNPGSNAGASNSKGVAYTCTKNISQNGNSGTISADVVYSDNGYETTIYYKMVVNYAKMDDEKMLSLLKDIDPYGGTKMSPNYEKFNVNGTTELGIVDDFGLDTTITRSGNTVTYTYYQSNYNNYQQLTSSDKEALKEEFKSQGFTIK